MSTHKANWAGISTVISLSCMPEQQPLLPGKAQALCATLSPRHHNAILRVSKIKFVIFLHDLPCACIQWKANLFLMFSFVAFNYIINFSRKFFYISIYFML